MPTRQIQIGSTKCLFDNLIDRHAEAYLAAYPEVKEFSNYDKSGTSNYYIGMVWTNDNEKPDTQQLKIRGSLSMADNRLLELDLSIVDSPQSFFPGQIVAFKAKPSVKGQLTVVKFLDPMKISPPLKKINTDAKMKLIIACGPYMKSDQEDWQLYDKLIESIKTNEATHIVLLGPFVDMDNKRIRAHYDTYWRMVFDKIVDGLYEHECQIFIVPSNRDVLPCNFSSMYLYPCPELDLKHYLRKGIKPKFNIKSVSDPAQIDLGGLFLDVTSAEVLFNLNQCTAFINKGLVNTFTSLYKHIITHGIYPMYPPSGDLAVDYTQLGRFIQLDRLGAHIIVLPTKFVTQVSNVENRLIVPVQKCCTKKQVVLIEIPKIESSQEEPIDSVVITDYTFRMIDIMTTNETRTIVDDEMALVSSLETKAPQADEDLTT